MRDACIAAQQPCWPVTGLCEVRGVGRRGFSADQKRQAAPARSHEEIDGLARRKALAEKTQHRSGRRRLGKHLQDEGEDVGRCTGRRVMQLAGVSGESRRRRGPQPPESRHGSGVAPQLRARHCAVTAPHGAWCGDSTYLWTAEGWW